MGVYFYLRCRTFLWYISGIHSIHSAILLSFKSDRCLAVSNLHIIQYHKRNMWYVVCSMHVMCIENKLDSFITVQRTLFRHRESGRSISTQIWMIWRLSRHFVCLFYELYIFHSKHNSQVCLFIVLNKNVSQMPIASAILKENLHQMRKTKILIYYYLKSNLSLLEIIR